MILLLKVLLRKMKDVFFGEKKGKNQNSIRNRYTTEELKSVDSTEHVQSTLAYTKLFLFVKVEETQHVSVIQFSRVYSFFTINIIMKGKTQRT